VFGPTARRVGDDELFEIEGLLSDDEIERARRDGYEVTCTRDAERVAEERLRRESE